MLFVLLGMDVSVCVPRLKSFRLAAAAVAAAIVCCFFLPIHYTATKLAVMVMVIVILFPTQIKDGLNKCLRHDTEHKHTHAHVVQYGIASQQN